jgi:hypothetical protein
MDDRVYKWCCKNTECKRQNIADVSAIEEAKKAREQIYLICGTCGVVQMWSGSICSNGKDWLQCLPFKGTEMTMPLGKTDKGKYLDYQGSAIERDDFIIKYGVDPELYLIWVKNGKPKYKNICE